MERLSTGISGLDRLLKGGFALRKINLVYGEASTGKTVLSMQTALEAAARGLKGSLTRISPSRFTDLNP